MEGMGRFETAMPAAAGAPGGGMGQWLPKRLRGALDGGDGPVETAMPAAAGAPGGGDGPDADETATDPSLTGIALRTPNSNALDNFFKMFDGK